jgi:hypothetical protein
MRVFPEGPTVQVATAEPGSVSFIKLASSPKAYGFFVRQETLD